MNEGLVMLGFAAAGFMAGGISAFAVLVPHIVRTNRRLDALREAKKG